MGEGKPLRAVFGSVLLLICGVSTIYIGIVDFRIVVERTRITFDAWGLLPVFVGFLWILSGWFMFQVSRSGTGALMAFVLGLEITAIFVGYQASDPKMVVMGILPLVAGMLGLFAQPRIQKIQLQVVLLVGVIAYAGVAAHYLMRPQGPPTIEFWTHVTGAWVEPTKTLMEEYSNLTGIQFHVTEGISPAYFTTKILTSAVAGELPDIILMHAYWLPEMVESGVFLRAPEDVAADVKANWTQAGVDAVTYDGKIYGYPDSSSLYQLVYNKQLFQEYNNTLTEAGLDPNRPPETWEELRGYARALTNSTEARIGFGFHFDPTNLLDSFKALLWSNGGRIYDEETNELVVNSQEGEQTLQLLVDMVRDGSTNWEGTDLYVAYIGTGKGNCGMVIQGSWFGPILQQYSMDRYDYSGVAPIPYGNPEFSNITLAYTWGLFVPSTTKHAREVWDFLKWFTKPGRSSQAIYASGSISFRKEELDSPEMTIDDWHRSFGRGVGYAKVTKPFPHYNEVVEGVIFRHIQNALSGRETVEEALEKAVAEGNAILSGR